MNIGQLYQIKGIKLQILNKNAIVNDWKVADQLNFTENNKFLF